MRQRLLLIVKNKIEKAIEELQDTISQKIDNAFKRIKAYFVNNLEDFKRKNWNKQVEPRFQAITNQELASDIEDFIKSNNKNVKQEYPGYLFDNIFSLIRTNKISDLIKTVKKNINDSNKEKANELIELLSIINGNNETGLSMRHTLKM